MIRRARTAAGQIALIVAAGLAGETAHAATPLYWPGGDYGYDRAIYDRNIEQPRRRMSRQPRMPKAEAAKAEKLAQNAGKPTGPLIIAVSIERQTVKVYDANGIFAESPISSGMKGHTTPMGVFSVIQKNKFHRSNIYSDAPMPYMQRITWSGVAMHAGALPGYPASHGCIRMPMSFAVKMWGWTRMGARVVIVPGEISPTSIAHPVLASLRATPAPMASVAPLQPKIADALPVVNTKTADASNSMAAVVVADMPATAAPSAEAKPAEPQVVIDPPVVAETLILSGAPAVAEKPVVAETVVPPAPVEKPMATETAAPTSPAQATKSGSGPVAIFVSRKDARLYVRQNFTALFDVPVTISGDQPLGTHVFTARANKDTSKPVEWTALSLPSPTRSDEPVLSRRRQDAGAIVTTPPMVEASAAEALDRLKLPEDLAAKLGDQLSTGSSLIVSDQGIATSGETGKGTDFIMRYR